MKSPANLSQEVPQTPESAKLGELDNRWFCKHNELMGLIQGWFGPWTQRYESMWDGLATDPPTPTFKYILVAAQTDKATELRDKLDSFRVKFILQ